MGNRDASSIEKMGRKVNKPRISLRKRMVGPRHLNPMYRGVVPMLLQFNADITELERYPPETILQMIGMFMNGKHTHLVLTKPKLAKLRAYLKKHNIADWTRGVDGPDEDRGTAGTPRRGEGQGRKRLGDVRLPLRSVDAQ